jgi:flavin-dependent dehydrogenase
MQERVVVVGGSAAGLLTATLLARGGVPVTVVESTPGVRPAPRSLIVTAELRSLVGPIAERSVVNEIRRFELFADGRVASVELAEHDLIIERATLIKELAGQARSEGVHIISGHRFLGLRPAGDGLAVSVGASGKTGQEEEIAASTVVGADGASSAVGRAAGWPRQPTVPLLQAIVSLPPDLAPDTTRVWFRPEDTRYFYWLIPDSPTRGALGVIGEGAGARRRLDRFLRERGLEPLEYQAARIPRYRQWIRVHRRLGRGHVYLVGDAAGHVKVSTVGGTVTGLRGARAVATAILGGRAGPELRALRRELYVHLLVRRLLHRFTVDDYRRLLDLMDDAAGRVLGSYHRDDARKMFSRLMLSRPRIMLFGLRAGLSAGPGPVPSAEGSSEGGGQATGGPALPVLGDG